MTRPRLLDLFCGAGGASMGYHRAGFDVIGVDIVAQPRYPFLFVQMDVFDYLSNIDEDFFNAIHASPPCKVWTRLRKFSAEHHTDLIPHTRAALRSLRIPYVIENVPGAPLRDPITLCGSSFDLGVQRHRLFESSVPLAAPLCDHAGQAARSPGYPVKRYHSGKPVTVMSPVIGVYGRGQGLGPGEFALWKQAMDIDWMNKDEMRESIPPAYTEHLGAQLLTHIAWQEAA